MDITSAEWMPEMPGSIPMIKAVIDDQEMYVPDDMGNRHRQALDDWEKAGNTITPAKQEGT